MGPSMPWMLVFLEPRLQPKQTPPAASQLAWVLFSRVAHVRCDGPHVLLLPLLDELVDDDIDNPLFIRDCDATWLWTLKLCELPRPTTTPIHVRHDAPQNPPLTQRGINMACTVCIFKWHSAYRGVN